MFKKLFAVVALLVLCSGVRAQVVYSAIPGPYFALSAANGLLGFDDYFTTQNTPTMNLTSFRFVGGVTSTATNRNTLLVGFYNLAGTVLQNSFSIALPSSSISIWSITAPSNFVVPTSGLVAIFATNTTTGQWYLTSTAPSTGSNNPAFGQGYTSGGKPLYQAFELSGIAIVPEPGLLSMFGAMSVGGIAFLRRRRV